MSFSTCVSMHPKARKVDYGEDMFSNVPAVGTDIPGILHQNVVADDFGYVCLDKGKRELVNVVDNSKHNAETSHAQRLRQ